MAKRPCGKRMSASRRTAEDALAVTLLAHVDTPCILRQRLSAGKAPSAAAPRGLRRRSLGTNSARQAFQPRQIFELVYVA
jgi:hypothetical protein